MSKSFFIALSLLLVLLSSGFVYWSSTFFPNKVDSFIQKIDMSFYSHRGAVPVVNEPDTDVMYNKISAVEKIYLTGNRLNALVGFNNLLLEDPGNMELMVRVAIIYTQEKQFDAALENLKLVYDFKDSVYSPDAAWFIALIYFQMGKDKQAVSLLKEIVENRGNFFLNAQELLNCR
jgi:hypothetical protein